MRNLDAGEITMQVVETARLLEPQGERVSHVVFMGMGEPFENYDAVLSSIRLLVHPDIMAMSQRHLTVSTVGIPSQIRRFADEGLKVNLVLSLHAPNQRIRQKIIPYARKYPIEELLESMLYFARTTRRDITYEYTLLAGINDRYEDAEELARLVRGHPCTVNLIPYNPVEGLRLDRPSGATIESFRAVLEEAGLSVTWRYTKGKEIAAACGQLALHTTQESARAEKVATAIS
jgi:23S rRNA (adenine2503-C2)-methyltransferase